MLNTNIKVGLYLAKLFPRITKVVCMDNLPVVFLPIEDFLIFVKLIKTHYCFKMVALMDIWGVDYLGLQRRFEVNYCFLSVQFNLRFIVRLCLGLRKSIPSLVFDFGSSGWLEREVWDMYGVFFFGNPDLRRILTDYGFEGYPLRKDFPLTGFVEVRYDEEQKMVLQEPVEIMQAFRVFNFKSPWE